MEAGWLFVSVMGLLPAFFAWRMRRSTSRLASARRTSTGDPGEGLICCRGKVVPMTTIEAPVSKKSCVHYEITIEAQNDESDPRKRRWHHVKTKRGGGKFHIDDGSGKLGVNASSFEGGLERTYRGTAPFRGPKEFLEEEGLDAVLTAVTGLETPKEWGSRRATERIIGAGGTLLVIGEARAGQIVLEEEPPYVSRWPRSIVIAQNHVRWVLWAGLAGFFVVSGFALASDAARAAVMDALHRLWLAQRQH